MNFFTRRTALAAISALALAACGDTGSTAAPGTKVGDKGELGHVRGSADAPVTLIEYASPTCPACKYWHDSIQPIIMEEYVDTGKVKFVFREYPLHSPDVPAYLVALCAGEDKYFDVLDELFQYQTGIVDAAQNGVLKPALMTIAERHGIEGEAAFDACMNNREQREHMADIVQTSEKYGVTGTPTFVIDGVKFEFGKMNRLEDVKQNLNNALGDLAPAAEETPAADETIPADATPADAAIDATDAEDTTE